MIVTKRESMASLIPDRSPTLRHSLQQSHNKVLYYGFRDAILSRLVTIIKRLVHHVVYFRISLGPVEALFWIANSRCRKTKFQLAIARYFPRFSDFAGL